MTTLALEASDCTGIGVIDAQHDEILGQIARLLGLAQGDAIDGSIGETLNRIVSLTLAHFEFEEELMEQAGYPFIKVHKRLHDHFIQRLAGYTQRFDAGEAVVDEMAQFLEGWLRSHFTHEDRDYSPQILAEMQGLVAPHTERSGDGWLSRALRRIA